MAIGATLAFAGSAGAQSPGSAQKIVVKFGDLDLHGAKGQSVFQSRLAHGVALFCGPAPSTIRDLAGRASYSACIQDATAATLAQVHNDVRFARADVVVRRGGGAP